MLFFKLTYLMIFQQMLFVLAVLERLDVPAARATRPLVGPIHTEMSLVERPDTLLPVRAISRDFHGTETNGIDPTHVR